MGREGTDSPVSVPAQRLWLSLHSQVCTAPHRVNSKGFWADILVFWVQNPQTFPCPDCGSCPAHPITTCSGGGDFLRGQFQPQWSCLKADADRQSIWALALPLQFNYSKTSSNAPESMDRAAVAPLCPGWLGLHCSKGRIHLHTRI